MSGITLSVRGHGKSARRAGARHGISVTKCKEHKHGSYCQAKCRDLKKVMHWYGDRVNVKAGRGAPPGTLTFYSASCGLTGLKGKRKRRR